MRTGTAGVAAIAIAALICALASPTIAARVADDADELGSADDSYAGGEGRGAGAEEEVSTCKSCHLRHKGILLRGCGAEFPYGPGAEYFHPRNGDKKQEAPRERGLCPVYAELRCAMLTLRHGAAGKEDEPNIEIDLRNVKTPIQFHPTARLCFQLVEFSGGADGGEKSTTLCSDNSMCRDEWWKALSRSILCTNSGAHVQMRHEVAGEPLLEEEAEEVHEEGTVSLVHSRLRVIFAIRGELGRGMSTRFKRTKGSFVALRHILTVIKLNFSNSLAAICK